MAMPFDTIKGFVVDDDGHQVVDANVSLWQDGLLVPCNMGNPQQSLYYDDLNHYPSSNMYAGMFWLGMIYPGNYTVRAEKRGYVGTTIVNVTPVEVHYAFFVNVTLAGYHVPVLTPEQRNLTGGIAGAIVGINGTVWPGVKVTLWQDGDVVQMPGNPQLAAAMAVDGRGVNYKFDYLVPGRYSVVFEYRGQDNETKNVSVNVTDRIAMADIALTNLIPAVPPGPGTQVPVPSGPPLPSGGLDVLPVLSSLSVAVLLASRLRKAR